MNRIVGERKEVRMVQGRSIHNKCPFLIIRTYGSFTLETILATAFGRVVNIQQGESDELTEVVHTRFRQLEEGRSGSREAVILLTSMTNHFCMVSLCLLYHLFSFQVTFRG